MMRRWRNGEQLFHPQDNPEPDPTMPHTTGRDGLPVGVTWVWQRRKYRARIVDARTGQRVHLGMFDCLGDAAEAVRAALILMAGS